jgi:hypothetical protein
MIGAQTKFRFAHFPKVLAVKHAINTDGTIPFCTTSLYDSVQISLISKSDVVSVPRVLAIGAKGACNSLACGD